ncbi:MAG: hypothetical protein WBA46_13640, partial [Thermomicrobiales bacterium]
RSLVAALHEYGVATRIAPRAFAPWLPGHLHEMPTGAGSAARTARLPLSQPAPAAAAPPADVLSLEVMAWLAMVDDATDRVSSGDDGAIAASPSGAIDVPTDQEEIDAPPVPEDDPWAPMAAFEAACLAEIRSLEAGTATPAHPEGMPSLPDALAALSTLIDAGQIELLDANARAQRMRGLAECRTSLRTLAQQQEAGIRARSAILTERRGILARVASLAADMDDAEVPTATP